MNINNDWAERREKPALCPPLRSGLPAGSTGSGALEGVVARHAERVAHARQRMGKQGPFPQIWAAGRLLRQRLFKVILLSHRGGQADVRRAARRVGRPRRGARAREWEVLVRSPFLVPDLVPDSSQAVGAGTPQGS